jgi:hypothetical protein
MVNQVSVGRGTSQTWHPDISGPVKTLQDSCEAGETTIRARAWYVGQLLTTGSTGCILTQSRNDPNIVSLTSGLCTDLGAGHIK